MGVWNHPKDSELLLLSVVGSFKGSMGRPNFYETYPLWRSRRLHKESVQCRGQDRLSERMPEKQLRQVHLPVQVLNGMRNDDWRPNSNMPTESRQQLGAEVGFWVSSPGLLPVAFTALLGDLR